MSGISIFPSTTEERKQLFNEILLSKTDKVSEIADNTVLSGVGYAIAKISGKCEKDILQSLGKLYPDSSYGSQLDQCALESGVPTRFGASQSSVFIRVVGDVGTTYIAGTHIFTSSDGIQFDIENTTIIGVAQFSYVKVRSVDSGLKTNVKPATVNKVTPTPIGHRFCVNEYQAIGGRDIEDDILFRQRIKEGPNLLSRGTISMIEQAFMKINSNILLCKYQGINQNGQLRIAIQTQNGIALNSSELNNLLVKGEKYFGLSELRPYGRHSYGIELTNIEIQPFDISFRCDIDPSANPDDIRISIQTRISKYIDPRYFVSGKDKIDFVTLLEICRNTKGMRYVPDSTFSPAVDIPVDSNKIPRLRGFLLLALDGSVINTLQNTLSPVYYPSNPGFEYQQTVLRSL